MNGNKKVGVLECVVTSPFKGAASRKTTEAELVERKMI